MNLDQICTIEKNPRTGHWLLLFRETTYPIMAFMPRGIHRYWVRPSRGSAYFRSDAAGLVVILSYLSGNAMCWDAECPPDMGWELIIERNRILFEHENGWGWNLLEYSPHSKTFKRIGNIANHLTNTFGRSREGRFPFRLNKLGQVAIAR